MVQPRTIFHAGLKLIGVLTIIWAITHIMPVVMQFYTIYNQADMMPSGDLRYYRFSLIFQAVYPIVLFVIGFYLLKDGNAVARFTFREETPQNHMRDLFILLMKLAGLALLIYAVPRAFQLISNVLFISSAHIMDTAAQTAFVAQYAASTVIQLVLGFYLLNSGRLFVKIGFADEEDGKQ